MVWCRCRCVCVCVWQPIRREVDQHEIWHETWVYLTVRILPLPLSNPSNILHADVQNTNESNMSIWGAMLNSIYIVTLSQHRDYITQKGLSLMECSHWPTPTPTKWVCNPFTSVLLWVSVSVLESVSASVNSSAYYEFNPYFYTCLSFILFTRGGGGRGSASVHAGIPPPPPIRHPPDQTPHTPPDQADPPLD